jgi:hypothetical protein
MLSLAFKEPDGLSPAPEIARPHPLPGLVVGVNNMRGDFAHLPGMDDNIIEPHVCRSHAMVVLHGVLLVLLVSDNDSEAWHREQVDFATLPVDEYANPQVIPREDQADFHGLSLFLY